MPIIQYVSLCHSDVGANHDDSAMNSISLVCYGLTTAYYTQGYSGAAWEANFHTCVGGFDGMMVKFLAKVSYRRITLLSSLVTM